MRSDLLVQVGQLAGAALDGQAAVEDGHPGAVVAAILQSAQAVHDDTQRLLIPDVPNDSTHVLSVTGPVGASARNRRTGGGQSSQRCSAPRRCSAPLPPAGLGADAAAAERRAGYALTARVSGAPARRPARGRPSGRSGSPRDRYHPTAVHHSLARPSARRTTARPRARSDHRARPGRAGDAPPSRTLSLIHISEPTRLGM